MFSSWFVSCGFWRADVLLSFLIFVLDWSTEQVDLFYCAENRQLFILHFSEYPHFEWLLTFSLQCFEFLLSTSSLIHSQNLWSPLCLWVDLKLTVKLESLLQSLNINAGYNLQPWDNTFPDVSELFKISWIHSLSPPCLICNPNLSSPSPDSSSDSFSLPSIPGPNSYHFCLPSLERHSYPEAVAGFTITLCSQHTEGNTATMEHPFLKIYEIMSEPLATMWVGDGERLSKNRWFRHIVFLMNLMTYSNTTEMIFFCLFACVIRWCGGARLHLFFSLRHIWKRLSSCFKKQRLLMEIQMWHLLCVSRT